MSIIEPWTRERLWHTWESGLRRWCWSAEGNPSPQWRHSFTWDKLEQTLTEGWLLEMSKQLVLRVKGNEVGWMRTLVDLQKKKNKWWGLEQLGWQVSKCEHVLCCRLDISPISLNAESCSWNACSNGGALVNIVPHVASKIDAGPTRLFSMKTLNGVAFGV